MFCSRCGKQLNQNENYCSNCGNTIVNGMNQNMYYYNQGNAVVQNDINTKKNASLILGIVGLVIGNIICAILAICLGAGYKKETGETPAGLVLGIVGTALSVLSIFFLFFVIFLPWMIAV